jgi:hypothetical protein
MRKNDIDHDRIFKKEKNSGNFLRGILLKSLFENPELML